MEGWKERSPDKFTRKYSRELVDKWRVHLVKSMPLFPPIARPPVPLSPFPSFPRHFGVLSIFDQRIKSIVDLSGARLQPLDSKTKASVCAR